MRASMHISLPEVMRAWVDQQIREGGYGTASEYIRHLLREEQQRQQRGEIDNQLLRSLDSGEPIPVDDQFWRQRRQAVERLRRKKE